MIAQQVYQRGYAVMPSLLRAETVERLLFESREIQAAHDASRGGVRNLLAIPSMRALAESPAAMNVVHSILGSEVRPVRGILFDKTPDANWKVPWHQDVTIAVRKRAETEGYGPWSIKDGVLHVQPPAAVLVQMLSVRIHLDDCPESNGALRVIPGSHLHGKVRAADVERIASEAKAAVCEVAVGGALLMRPLLFHASSASTHPGHRRVLHFDCAACDLPHGLDWYEEANA